MFPSDLKYHLFIFYIYIHTYIGGYIVMYRFLFSVYWFACLHLCAVLTFFFFSIFCYFLGWIPLLLFFLFFFSNVCWLFVFKKYIYLFGCFGSSLHYVRIFHSSTQTLVAARRLSCSTTCGILVPWPGLELVSPALQSEFLTTRPPEKSLLEYSCIFNPPNKCYNFLNSSGTCLYWVYKLTWGESFALERKKKAKYLQIKQG